LILTVFGDAMQRTLCYLTIFLGALFVFAAVPRARAQESAPAPRVDIFAGYSYMRSNIVTSGTLFSLNGGSGSVAFNVTNWFGLVGDFGVYDQGNAVHEDRSLTLTSYQFGPRISIRGHALIPFGQVLFGGGHATGTLYTTSLGNGSAPLGPSTGFMFTAGGGLDWKLNRTIGIRIVQTEYLYSTFLNAAASPDTNRQNNIRISAGILFSFGQR
jgi:hypothetical protein